MALSESGGQRQPRGQLFEDAFPEPIGAPAEREQLAVAERQPPIPHEAKCLGRVPEEQAAQLIVVDEFVDEDPDAAAQVLIAAGHHVPPPLDKAKSTPPRCLCAQSATTSHQSVI